MQSYATVMIVAVTICRYVHICLIFFFLSTLPCAISSNWLINYYSTATNFGIFFLCTCAKLSLQCVVSIQYCCKYNAVKHLHEAVFILYPCRNQYVNLCQILHSDKRWRYWKKSINSFRSLSPVLLTVRRFIVPLQCSNFYYVFSCFGYQTQNNAVTSKTTACWN